MNKADIGLTAKGDETDDLLISIEFVEDLFKATRDRDFENRHREQLKKSKVQSMPSQALGALPEEKSPQSEILHVNVLSISDQAFALNLFKHFTGEKNYAFSSVEITDLKESFRSTVVRSGNRDGMSALNNFLSSTGSLWTQIAPQKLLSGIEKITLPIAGSSLLSVKQNILLLCLEYANNPSRSELQRQKGIFLSNLLNILIENEQSANPIPYLACVEEAKRRANTAIVLQQDVFNSRVGDIIERLTNLDPRHEDNPQERKGIRRNS